MERKLLTHGSAREIKHASLLPREDGTFVLHIMITLTERQSVINARDLIVWVGSSPHRLAPTVTDLQIGNSVSLEIKTPIEITVNPAGVQVGEFKIESEA